MKTEDYINSLIEEKENLKSTCKTHVETIRLMKRELVKLNNTISKKDKKILKLENESVCVKTQKELQNINIKFDNLKAEYDNLLYMYNSVVEENNELNNILDNINKLCDDSD